MKYVRSGSQALSPFLLLMRLPLYSMIFLLQEYQISYPACCRKRYLLQKFPLLHRNYCRIPQDCHCYSCYHRLFFPILHKG